MCNNKIKLILMKHKRKSCHHKENGISFIRDIMKKETKEAKCDKAKLSLQNTGLPKLIHDDYKFF